VNKLKLVGSLIELSEGSDQTSFDAKFLICPLDIGNANGVGLKESDLTEAEKKGLENQPVVCKVIKNSKGEYDFTGHNMKVKYETDENGNKIKKHEFDTSPIGFHTSVSIEEVELNGENKKCIVAIAKIWKRYDKAISALNRILDLKKKIKTSWEISYADSYKEDNIKWLKDIVWLGNCVLGEFVNSAYKDAGLIELSEENEEIQLAMAFTEDLFNEISQIDDESINDININKGGTEVMKENEVKIENSSMTDNDLYTKVRKAINSTDNNKWYYVARLYPYEYRAVVYEWDRESEDNYIEFSYTVNSDETVSINSQKEVKMMFIPKADYETQISELQEKLASTEKEFSEAGKAVAELTKEKEVLKTQISELTPLESNEQLSIIFSELTLDNFESSQEKIEIIKGRKAIEKFKATKQEKEENLETSEVKTKTSQTKTDLNNGEDDGILSATDIVKMMIFKNKNK
jgi:hypothetical protein